MSEFLDAADPDGVISWRRCRPPQVRQIALAIPLDVSSVQRDCLAVAAAVETPLSPVIAARPPRVVSVPIARGRGPRTRSFTFSTPQESELFDAANADCQTNDCPTVSAPATNAQQQRFLPAGPAIRIQPPCDVVKLSDRLDYILQPSLQTLMAERCLSFPFEPFAYQFEGVAFLYPRHAAILADEMGLGKTMQTVTAIRLLLRRGELRRVLLVCPKPLVTNWRREFSLWAPEVPTIVIEGNRQTRRWRWQLPDAPVKIANYELLHRDLDFFDHDLDQLGVDANGNGVDELGVETAGAADVKGNKPPIFDLVVLDESQRIKNRHSATSQAARSIRGRRRWALTGTPVENSPDDLVGIFEFLAPGFLSPELRPRKMGRTVRDHILRRTKEQVLVDLPPKMFRDADLELSPEQYESYKMAEDEGVVRLNALGDQLSIQHVFELVLRLKQICNFDPASGESSKFERLEADLEEVAASGRKAIVFSQWVQTLKTLSRRLRRFGPLEYHGDIHSRRREDNIKRFYDDPDAHVMLLSYGAGSVGLNLQRAGYAFLFDRWWNPAVEDQAINRVHRIGTTAPVTVCRFLMLGTIEERINRILEEKRQLFDIILSGAQGAHKTGLTQDEVFGLFDLKIAKAPTRAAA